MDYPNFRTLLQGQALLNAANGDLHAAIEALVENYKFAAHLSDPKMAITFALGRLISTNLTFRILADTQIDAAQLNILQQQVETILCRQTEWHFEWDRIQALDLIQRIFTDDGHGNGRLVFSDLSKGQVEGYIMRQQDSSVAQSGFIRALRDLFNRDDMATPHAGIKTFSIALFGPDRKQTLKLVEDYYSYLENLSKETPWQWRLRAINPQKAIADMKRNCLLSDAMGMQEDFMVIRDNYIARAYESALLTTIALLRYKADKGKLPQTLNELVADGYLKELPMDPFSDKTLVYKQTGDDFTLYSVGTDFADNNGTPGRWHDNGKDIVFWPVQKSN